MEEVAHPRLGFRNKVRNSQEPPLTFETGVPSICQIGAIALRQLDKEMCIGLGSCNDLFGYVWPASYIVVNGRRLEPSLLQYHTEPLTIRSSV